MLSTIIFLVLLSIGFIQTTVSTDESCNAQISTWSDPCMGTIIVPRPCESATLNLGTTPFKPCDALNFMWSYPLNNLTITIETPFTQQHQSYAINIKNLKDYNIRKYRIINGQETEIKSTKDVIVLNSDSNYEIILKLQAETIISYYIFPFAYNVTKS